MGQLAVALTRQTTENCQIGRRLKLEKLSFQHRMFKLEERQQRNRQAAKRSKQRQQQLEQTLNAEIRRLEQENNHIDNAIIQLKSKLHRLQLDLFEITLLEYNPYDTQLVSSSSNIIDIDTIFQQNLRTYNDTIRVFDIDLEFDDLMDT
jgi:predicted nuclease with TOPRIM domain